jgi:hypothetical protein
MEYLKEKREIKLDRELSKLDEFVIDFIKILEKHMDYAIISGYVSILLGRSRATEDVDVYIKKISLEKFSRFYKEIENAGFWCINAEKPEEIFSYLADGFAVRFARKNTAIPNFEVKFPKREVDEETFQDFITVNLEDNKLKISSLERQIAFKRYYLCSDKDEEDAVHIEELFREKIDYEKVNKLKQVIEKIREEESKNERE